MLLALSLGGGWRKIDDERARPAFLGHRHPHAEAQEKKQEQEIKPEREGESRRAAAERRPLVWQGESVGGQGRAEDPRRVERA